MYFRDMTALLPSLEEHEMWVALEAAAGIVSKHDYDPGSFCTKKINGCNPYGKGAWWNVSHDPFRQSVGDPIYQVCVSHSIMIQFV